jgi:hypothetical protein
MISVLLLLLTAQVPAVPGRLSACAALRETHPQKAAELEAEVAKSALRLEAMRAAEEEALEKFIDAAEAEGEAAPEPPDCRGDDHHVEAVHEVPARDLQPP